MKILIVGGGGREHAIAWKLFQSPLRPSLIAAPGNAGISSVAVCVAVKPDDLDGLVQLAVRERVDGVVIGPEGPLVSGLADRLTIKKIPVFGPSAAAARLEGSKGFSKQFMIDHHIPTARFESFDDPATARGFLKTIGLPCVVKADGLAAGKGVMIATTEAEFNAALDSCFVSKKFGAAGSRVVIEEFLRGTEASVLAVCDGSTALLLAPAKDHKTIGEGDTGPNTGGMGVISPAPAVDDKLLEEVRVTVIEPTLAGLKKMGSPFIGILYAGLMLTEQGVRVLEFNVRFGDPETQAILRRMKSDLLGVVMAAATGGLKTMRLDWDPRPSVCVIMAAAGYPGTPRTGDVIEGLQAAGGLPEVVVFHSGTMLQGDRIVTAGGRVLGVTALGRDLIEARARAYEGVSRISWPGAYFRRDIGESAKAHEKK